MVISPYNLISNKLTYTYNLSARIIYGPTVPIEVYYKYMYNLNLSTKLTRYIKI